MKKTTNEEWNKLKQDYLEGCIDKEVGEVWLDKNEVPLRIVIALAKKTA